MRAVLYTVRTALESLSRANERVPNPVVSLSMAIDSERNGLHSQKNAIQKG